MSAQFSRMMRPGETYVLANDGYIRRSGSVKILGRVGGYSTGTGWYQLAATPYDETSVSGFAGKREAFEAATDELHRRAN